MDMIRYMNTLFWEDFPCECDDCRARREPWLGHGVLSAEDRADPSVMHKESETKVSLITSIARSLAVSAPWLRPLKRFGRRFNMRQRFLFRLDLFPVREQGVDRIGAVRVLVISLYFHLRFLPSCSWALTHSWARIADDKDTSPASTTAAMISASLSALPVP